MTAKRLAFSLDVDDGQGMADLAVARFLIAGWTGRDRAAVQKHIEELAALGVPPPVTTPVYYHVSPERLTGAGEIQVSGEASSGEVEVMLLRAGGRLWVGVGSDHTDRTVETYNITVSKQMCDKPVAPSLWAYEPVRPHWDQLVLRSWATIDGDRRLYQEGTLGAILPPDTLIEGAREGFGEGAAMFCGTFPALGGIRPASRFDFELADPVLGRSIRHGYAVAPLPVVG